MSAVETTNVVQALGAVFISIPPQPVGVPREISPNTGMSTFTRNAIGDYTILVDEPMIDSQNVIQTVVDGGKASVIINGANPRQLDVLLFNFIGGGLPPPAADLDFRIHVYQVPPTPP